MARTRPRASTEHSSELRLAKVLAEHLREKHTYVALAEAISAANHGGLDDKDVIDRRKLKKIIDGDADLVLSIAELHALDRYLEPLGEGLAYNSFFLRANILQTIADAAKPVTFLLGSKPVSESGLNLSHWDVKALAEIQRGVNNFAPDVRFDIQDVRLHDDIEDARRSVASGAWTKLLADNGPSLVCLGSSRATHAAELILAKMFGTPPFNDAPDTKARLPFHFVWPPDLDHVFPSSFQYTGQDLAAIDPKASRVILNKGASALETSGKVHLDRVKQQHASESFGVCVAQRRRGGQVWLVLAGITGTATYAAARLADRLALRLQPDQAGQPSPVFWTVVRASAKRDRSRVIGSYLVVEDQGIVSGPHAWGAE